MCTNILLWVLKVPCVVQTPSYEWHALERLLCHSSGMCYSNIGPCSHTAWLHSAHPLPDKHGTVQPNTHVKLPEVSVKPCVCTDLTVEDSCTHSVKSVCDTPHNGSLAGPVLSRGRCWARTPTDGWPLTGHMAWWSCSCTYCGNDNSNL